MKIVLGLFLVFYCFLTSYSQIWVKSGNKTDPPGHLVKWNALDSSQAVIIKTGLFENETGIGLGTTSPEGSFHIISQNQSGLIIEHNATIGGVRTLAITETSADSAIRASTKALSITGIQAGNPELFTVWGNGVVNSRTLYAEKVEIRTDALGINWPDYVFHTDYNLRPLSEVVKFYQSYHHLPEVPSAVEVSENGMDVAAMNALLLKKIEELTIYVAQLEQKVDELKQKQDQIKQ